MYYINMLDRQGCQVINHSEFAFTHPEAMEWVETMRLWALASYPYAHTITVTHKYLGEEKVESFPVWVEMSGGRMLAR